MVVKNYPAMCELLEETRKSSDSKKAQLKEWQRYFEFKRHGQAFIITKIYDEPLEVKDGRASGNNSIYIKYIQLLLLDYLRKQKIDEQSCQITYTQLFKELGMVNEFFTTHLDKDENDEPVEDKVGEYLIHENQIEEFLLESNERLHSIIKSAFKSLENRRILKVEKQYKIMYKQNPDDDFMVHIPATKEDKENILEIQKEALRDMGLKDVTAVYAMNRANEFYERVNSKLYKKFGWSGVYKQLEFICTPYTLSVGFKEILEETERELNRLELNRLVCGSITDTIEKNYEKTGCFFYDSLDYCVEVTKELVDRYIKLF